MEVILLERVEKLGQMGDIVNVKPGYARNYLLPQRKALRATKVNLERFEHERGQLEATNMEHRQEATAVAAKLEGLTCTLLRQASESAQLYGSVSARDIAQAVCDEGVNITRGQVQLEKPIKQLGIHRVRIALHPEVIVGIQANVARSAQEAEVQAAAGAGMPPPAETATETTPETAPPAEEASQPQDQTEPPDSAGDAAPTNGSDTEQKTGS